MWFVNGKIAGKPYCIVEAKASATSLNKSLGALLTDGRDKTERRTAQNQHQLQMSHEWCRLRLRNLRMFDNISNNYSRLVLFFNSTAVKDHLLIYDEIMRTNSQTLSLMEKHKKHEPTRIFDDVDIDNLVKTRTNSNKTSQSAAKIPRKKR